MATKSDKKGKKSSFFKGVKSELKRVSWPNRQELYSYTTVVIVVCVIVAIGLWFADSIFRAGLGLFL
ncbi:MAG: preprotein translocase subunit SecE [Candidatus Cloacimonadota bacterium]|nr:preprotein translocase subunit SecE [Candidatus Cloacimonadota bacterium]